MKTRWIIAAAIVALFASTMAWRVVAQNRDAVGEPLNPAEASPKSFDFGLGGNLNFGGDDDDERTFSFFVGVANAADLEEAYERLDEQAAKYAGELRELQATHGARHPRVAQLQSTLRSAVARLFELRQQLQRSELAEYQNRLARIEQKIEKREPIKDAIIDRRVEELINPALVWAPDVSEMQEVGGGAAPAEPVVPKDAGAQIPAEEQSDTKSRLREQFVSRFPETVAPEVTGPHRGTFIDEFVDISPDGDVVATVRPANERDSYACALWDRETGRRLAETVRPGTPVVVRFSANGACLGVGTFWTNQFEVFKVPSGEFIQTVGHEPYTSWEAAFNRFAEEHVGTARDPGRASTPNEDATVLSVDNQRELGIISAGSEDGIREGMTLRVHHGATYLGRITVVKTSQDTSLIRIEEENSEIPIRRGDRVTAAPPTQAEVGAARSTAATLAWDVLGTKLGERPAIGQYRGGLTIQGLRAQGPAAEAELRVGDVLVGLDRWETKSLADLRFALEDPDVRPQPGQTNDVKVYVVRDGETVRATLTIAAAKDGDRTATPPAPETEKFAVGGSVHLLIRSPLGATISWTPRPADGRSLFRVPPGLTLGGARKTLPASFAVAHGQRVPFHLWDMPGRGDLRLFGSLEIAPLSEALFPFMTSSAIPIEITEENLNRAWSGEQVVKVIYLAHGEHRENPEVEVKSLDAPGLKPEADPVDEVRRRGVELRRGQVLAILRLSRRNVSIRANEEPGPRIQLSPQQPSSSSPRESKAKSPEAKAPDSVKDGLKSAIENTN
jgi:hypothetical protein